MPASPITVEERLFSLVLALMASESGLTKADILSTVQGYSTRYAPHGENTALERQFERDKDNLREMGVPLETIDSPDRPGDNTAIRYLVPKRLYDLPGDITFSPEELGLLTLAAAVWREGSLSAESRRALLKLRARGVEASEPLLAYEPRLRVRETAWEPLQAALDSDSVVSFPYLKPGESAQRDRVVLPLAVVQFAGRWHLFAWDLDAAATRTYLLSRIVGDVKPLPSRHASGVTVDRETAGQRALDELADLYRSNRAVLQAGAGTDAAVRLAHRGSVDGERITLNFTDLNVLADELASFGPEVRVLAPDPLIDAVRQRLADVASVHGGTDDRG